MRDSAVLGLRPGQRLSAAKSDHPEHCAFRYFASVIRMKMSQDPSRLRGITTGSGASPILCEAGMTYCKLKPLVHAIILLVVGMCGHARAEEDSIFDNVKTGLCYGYVRNINEYYLEIGTKCVVTKRSPQDGKILAEGETVLKICGLGNYCRARVRSAPFEGSQDQFVIDILAIDNKGQDEPGPFPPGNAKLPKIQRRAYAETDPQKLIDIYNDLDNLCRGGPGNLKSTNDACETRSKVSDLLKHAGYCFSYPKVGWHSCKIIRKP